MLKITTYSFGYGCIFYYGYQAGHGGIYYKLHFMFHTWLKIIAKGIYEDKQVLKKVAKDLTISLLNLG